MYSHVTTLSFTVIYEKIELLKGHLLSFVVSYHLFVFFNNANTVSAEMWVWGFGNHAWYKSLVKSLTVFTHFHPMSALICRRVQCSVHSLFALLIHPSNSAILGNKCYVTLKKVDWFFIFVVKDLWPQVCNGNGRWNWIPFNFNNLVCMHWMP